MERLRAPSKRPTRLRNATLHTVYYAHHLPHQSLTETGKPEGRGALAGWLAVQLDRWTGGQARNVSHHISG